MDAIKPYGPSYARSHDGKQAPKPDVKVIDIHAHQLVEESEKIAGPHVNMAEQPFVKFSSPESNKAGIQQNIDRQAHISDIDTRLAEMNKMGIDIQVLSPVPIHAYYWVPADVAAEASRAINEGIAAVCAKKPDRLLGFGNVPLQDTKRAIAEMEHCVNTLGFKGIQILTNVNGEELSSPRLHDFWARVQELDIMVFLHPNGYTDGQRMANHYFINVIGNPLETTMAAHYLIFDGTMERYPNLKILLAHGGGYLGAYSGRIDHVWGAREDARTKLKSRPTDSLKKFYFDTVVFTPHQLKALVDLVGPDQVVMGTDYPYDMAEYDPVGHILGTPGLGEEAIRKMLHDTSARALKLG